MKIVKLKKENYQGKRFVARYQTRGFYDIAESGGGFAISYKPFERVRDMSFESAFFEEWLDEPAAYGAFHGDILLGYAEGFLEKWNHRYRVSNICVFEEQNRRCGIGGALMSKMIEEAGLCKARMVVLETQSCNERAIAFYKKYGFDIIGFDLYAYTNTDPDRHEVRIEMGMALDAGLTGKPL